MKSRKRMDEYFLHIFFCAALPMEKCVCARENFEKNPNFGNWLLLWRETHTHTLLETTGESAEGKGGCEQGQKCILRSRMLLPLPLPLLLPRLVHFFCAKKEDFSHSLTDKLFSSDERAWMNGRGRSHVWEKGFFFSFFALRSLQQIKGAYLMDATAKYHLVLNKVFS